MQTMESRKTVLKRTGKVRLSYGLLPEEKKMLESNGFDPSSLPPSLCTATVFCSCLSVTGVAMKNSAGGYEFYSPMLDSQFVTFGQSGIVFVRCSQNEQEASKCICFMNIMDMMSYMTMCSLHIGVPDSCDCIFVGDSRNFVGSLPRLSKYHFIYCMFPTTEIGRTMTMTVKDCFPQKVSDFSLFYNSFGSLYNCYQQFVIQEERQAPFVPQPHPVYRLRSNKRTKNYNNNAHE